MNSEKVFQMKFEKVYGLLMDKAARKGRTKAERSRNGADNRRCDKKTCCNNSNAHQLCIPLVLFFPFLSLFYFSFIFCLDFLSIVFLRFIFFRHEIVFLLLSILFKSMP